MGGQFTGWPEQAFDVLLKLEGEPSVVVRNESRKDRERLVREPMIALMQEIADADEAYDDFHVWGLGSMTWPWQRQSAAARVGQNAEFSLLFDLDGLQVRGSWWYPGPDQVGHFRAAVAEDTSGAELAEIVRVLQAKDFEITGDRLKRAPRGYPADHPRVDLLRHRSMSAVRPLGCEEWLHTSEAIERVLEAYEHLRPLNAWHSRHVANAT